MKTEINEKIKIEKVLNKIKTGSLVLEKENEKEIKLTKTKERGIKWRKVNYYKCPKYKSIIEIEIRKWN